MRPEDHARESIDRQLADCGWTLQDYKSLNLAAAPGIAVREFPLKTGFADDPGYVATIHPNGVKQQSPGQRPGDTAPPLSLKGIDRPHRRHPARTHRNRAAPFLKSQILRSLVASAPFSRAPTGSAFSAAEPGRFIPHRDRRSARPSLSALHSQLSTLPNDQHAEDIVEEVRQVFSKGNEFCRKITSKAKRPEELLQQFRTGYQPRIAVTVDMIATGTDVRPLECLLFMRNINSSALVRP